MRITWNEIRFAAAGIVLASLCSTGCQIDVGGQTLPSAYYLTDDVQHYSTGPEFKLSREAAAMQAYKDGVTTE